jgi:hypothetical protein
MNIKEETREPTPMGEVIGVSDWVAIGQCRLNTVCRRHRGH